MRLLVETPPPLEGRVVVLLPNGAREEPSRFRERHHPREVIRAVSSCGGSRGFLVTLPICTFFFFFFSLFGAWLVGMARRRLLARVGAWAGAHSLCAFDPCVGKSVGEGCNLVRVTVTVVICLGVGIEALSVGIASAPAGCGAL